MWIGVGNRPHDPILDITGVVCAQKSLVHHVSLNWNQITTFLNDMALLRQG